MEFKKKYLKTESLRILNLTCRIKKNDEKWPLHAKGGHAWAHPNNFFLGKLHLKTHLQSCMLGWPRNATYWLLGNELLQVDFFCIARTLVCNIKTHKPPPLFIPQREAIKCWRHQDWEQTCMQATYVWEKMKGS